MEGVIVQDLEVDIFIIHLLFDHSKQIGGGYFISVKIIFLPLFVLSEREGELGVSCYPCINAYPLNRFSKILFTRT